MARWRVVAAAIGAYLEDAAVIGPSRPAVRVPVLAIGADAEHGGVLAENAALTRKLDQLA